MLSALNDRPIESKLRRSNISQADLEVTSQLNVRQLILLKSLREIDFTIVKQYSKRFKVSTMTACRDLSHLQQQGQVLRLGKGRATVYCLPRGIL